MRGHIRQRHKKNCPNNPQNSGQSHPAHPSGETQTPTHPHKTTRTKRCDCPWQARYTDPTTSTKKIERTFSLRRQAEDWLTTQRSNILTGTHVDPRQADRPFTDVVEAWQESWYRLERGTTQRYESILNHYLLPEFAHTPIGRLTHEQIQRYVNKLANDPNVSAALTRGIYSTLRAACNYGTRMNLVRVNPCQNIDLPRSTPQQMLFLTANEINALANAIDPFYRTLIYTAAYTGLRAGELLALTRKDVDLLRGTLYVHRSLKDHNGSLSFGSTKTHMHRKVSLPKFLREMLAAHLENNPDPSPTSLVFASRQGKPLRHGNFYSRHFRPAVKQALPADKHGLRFHDLRHTCASLLINDGAHPLLVSKQLGHSSVEITLNRYSHLFPDVAESLAERLDATFTAAESEEPQSNVVVLR